MFAEDRCVSRVRPEIGSKWRKIGSNATDEYPWMISITPELETCRGSSMNDARKGCEAQDAAYVHGGSA